MKKLSLEQMENVKGGGFLSDLLECYADAYTGRGLSSVGLIICTAALPETSLLVLAGCVVQVKTS